MNMVFVASSLYLYDILQSAVYLVLRYHNERKDKNIDKRIFHNIAVVNIFGMYDYSILSFDHSTTTLTITGDRGYGNYSVLIAFSNVEYVACSPWFGDNFDFRHATTEEISTLKDYADPTTFQWYCIEEDISGYIPPLNRDARRFFIAAMGVEITVEYDGNLDDLLKCDWSLYN